VVACVVVAASRSPGGTPGCAAPDRLRLDAGAGHDMLYPPATGM
jgi:hypothetical protein